MDNNESSILFPLLATFIFFITAGIMWIFENDQGYTHGKAKDTAAPVMKSTRTQGSHRETQYKRMTPKKHTPVTEIKHSKARLDQGQSSNNEKSVEDRSSIVENPKDTMPTPSCSSASTTKPKLPTPSGAPTWRVTKITSDLFCAALYTLIANAPPVTKKSVESKKETKPQHKIFRIVTPGPSVLQQLPNTEKFIQSKEEREQECKAARRYIVLRSNRPQAPSVEKLEVSDEQNKKTVIRAKKVAVVRSVSILPPNLVKVRAVKNENEEKRTVIKRVTRQTTDQVQPPNARNEDKVEIDSKENDKVPKKQSEPESSQPKSAQKTKPKQLMLYRVHTVRQNS